MLPFGRKYTAEYINTAHLLGIKHFEISTESSCYSEDFIANGEIYSIHAPKNILDETDLRRLRSELERLRDNSNIIINISAQGICVPGCGQRNSLKIPVN